MKTLMSLAVALSLAACAQVKPDGSSSPMPESATSVPSGASTGTTVAIAANAAMPARAQAAPAAARRGDPDPKDMTTYKVAVAQRIADANAHGVKTDAPRPSDAYIRGLTVVTMYVNKNGKLDKLLVLRSSGSDELDRRAIDAIKLAEPLPQPPDNVTMGNDYAVFPESFIHRTDGRFQLVSKTMTGTDASSSMASKASSVKRASTTAATKPAAKTVTQ